MERPTHRQRLIHETESCARTFDPDLALKRTGQDPEFLAAIMELFLKNKPHMIDIFQESLARKDLDAVGEIAREVWSMCQNLGAELARHTSGHLDQNCQNQDPLAVHRLYLILADQLEDLEEEMKQWLADSNPRKFEVYNHGGEPGNL